ncbi:MAG TPA: GNAT family N-acetyltransferase [Candidatus Limnocylindrales bacterium]|jgi:ribosomal protein S18 acetylase RimI-like enzyme
MSDPLPGLTGDAIAFRRPTEDDQPRVVERVDHWFGGRRVWPLVGRTWFRHFASTSLLAEDTEAADRAPLGFLLGFVSPDRPDEAVLHLVAVEPNHRRLGLGRRLVDAFAADAAAAGARSIRAVAWPDDRPAVVFFRAIGFRAEEGPGSMNLYGVPAWPDHEFDGEDRAVFVREVAPPA